jgi:heme exporter protein B
LNAFRHYVTLVAKDFRIEIRGKQFIVTSVAFGILMIFIMGIALDASSQIPMTWSAGLFWLTIFFTVSLGLNRRDDKDSEFQAWRAIWMAPLDRSLVYYAKWTSSSVFVLVTEFALMGAYFVILNQPFPARFGEFLLVLAGGAVGLTGIGSFLATMAATSTLREVLVPLLLFPLAIPLFLALIRLTVVSMVSSQAVNWIWVDVLCGYVVVFAVLPWLLYEVMVEV